MGKESGQKARSYPRWIYIYVYDNLISRSVYFSGNQPSNANASVLATLTMLGTFRLIADNPVPTELLPAVRFGSVVVNSKVLKMGGSFHDKRKILLWGTID